MSIIVIAGIMIVVGYLFGSVSSAIITCKLMGLPDPRTSGSGNPGATNVLRVGGKKAAAVTLIGDFLKGVLPVLAAVALGLDGLWLALVGMAAFLGHLYPVFFGFKGGKGVATGFGVLLGWSWLACLFTAGTWLLMALIFRISSLSALVSFAAAPLFVWFTTHDRYLAGMMLIITVITYWRHRSNIRDLIHGKEGRIDKQVGSG